MQGCSGWSELREHRITAIDLQSATAAFWEKVLPEAASKALSIKCKQAMEERGLEYPFEVSCLDTGIVIGDGSLISDHIRSSNLAQAISPPYPSYRSTQFEVVVPSRIDETERVEALSQGLG